MNADKYLLSFTAAGLSVARSVRIAETYLQLRDWNAVKEQVTTQNLIQARTRKSVMRIYHELALRLRALDDAQLTLLAEGMPSEQRHILWIAVCKTYTFIREFATEVLHEKYLSLSYILTDFDYAVFFNRKADWHSELQKISDTTRAKIRQVIFRMLREAELLSADNIIMPTLVSPRVLTTFTYDLPEIATWFPVTISTTLE